MTAMTPTRTEPDLSFLLDHTSHVLRTRMSAALAEIGLTARMHCVLVHALEEERTQIQLAEIGDMDKTTMVVTVDALEKAGLAERRPSRTDRRARIVAVTEEGARVAGRSRGIVDRVHREALAALPEGDREALLRALSRLVDDSLATPVEAPRTARRARQSQ
ncbi:MarR family winged helix-turn-helix transcriptional regulator [Streptomyces sp. NPDC003016]